MSSFHQTGATPADHSAASCFSDRQSDKEIKDLAKTYESMKPKEAADVLAKMSNDLDTVARIMTAMSADSRAKIMDQMEPDFAANVTKKLMP